MKTKDTHRVARKVAAIANSEARTKALVQLERWASAGAPVLFAFDGGLFFSYVAGRVAKRLGPWQEFSFASLDGVFQIILVITENESVELFDVEGRFGIAAHGDGAAFLIVEVEAAADVPAMLSEMQLDTQFTRSAQRYAKTARN